MVTLKDTILHVIVTMTMENLSIATKVLINVGITKLVLKAIITRFENVELHFLINAGKARI